MADHYMLTFNMKTYHSYSISEIENMIPYDRDIHVGLIQNKLAEEKMNLEDGSVWNPGGV